MYLYHERVVSNCHGFIKKSLCVLSLACHSHAAAAAKQIKAAYVMSHTIKVERYRTSSISYRRDGHK
jgi:hypothetical protein